jgi:hypothetical protein
MTAEHVHTPARATHPLPFWFCVAPEACVPQAHGGTIYREACACGASRLIARRQKATETGPWLPALVWEHGGQP